MNGMSRQKAKQRKTVKAPRRNAAAAARQTAPSVAHDPSNELVSLLRMALRRVAQRLYGRARILFGCPLLVFLTSCTQSTGALAPFTSPSDQPGIQRIGVTDFNFPADPIPPSAVTVTLAPSTPPPVARRCASERPRKAEPRDLV